MITLIAESNYSKEAIATYRKLGPVYFYYAERNSQKKRSEFLKKANILVVRLALHVTHALIDRMPNLKIIATSTTGLNHIDVAHAEKKGIRIISLRGHTSFLRNIPSTAEETFGLMLALVRNIPWAFEDVKAGRWMTNDWVGHELYGKTLGVLGFGRLGTLVAKYAQSFGMNVVGCDPYVSAEAMKKKGVKKVTMKELFKISDIVSLHVLLTERTEALVKASHVKTMKRTAFLINTARGEIIEKGALYQALKNKWIKGAATDVMWDEKSNGAHLKKDALWQYAKKNKNLIIVPHIGGTTFEAMETTQIFIADLVLRYGKKIKAI